jgi:catechol 2,3-dioxygenase-like lactoylglutathione lyase family enzyme
MARLVLGVTLCLLGGCTSTQGAHSAPTQGSKEAGMRLGNFSMSLAVKDLAVSRAFYEKLGLRAIAGEPAQGWLILQNETSTIGLFQGIVERNTLTYNPGWTRSGEPLADFEDVREIQRELRRQGIEPASAADESTTGPASLVVIDPDGNPILLDQHVPSPPR